MEQTIDHLASTSQACDDFPVGALKTVTFTTGSLSHPMVAAEVAGNAVRESKPPIVMIHGGFHTGQAFLKTADGRPGWAALFAQRGHRVVVPDWPAHGQSPGLKNIHLLNTQHIAESFGALLRNVGPCVVMAHSAGGLSLIHI